MQKMKKWFLALTVAVAAGSLALTAPALAGEPAPTPAQDDGWSMMGASWEATDESWSMMGAGWIKSDESWDTYGNGWGMMGSGNGWGMMGGGMTSMH